MSTHIGDKIFQNIPRRVAMFRENRPREYRNVEKSVVGKITRPKYNSLPLSLERYAGDCNKSVKASRSLSNILYATIQTFDNLSGSCLYSM